MPTKNTRRSHSGPKRDAQTHEAILAATLALLDDVGYGSLTIEGVAAKAGVGKTTIYRWWPSKGALVGEALSTKLSKGPEEETGDLRQDLLQTVRVTLENYAGQSSPVAVLAFAAHVERDFDLLESFRKDFLADRRRHGREMLERAVSRGQLPQDTDIDLMMDIWAGAIFYRSHITGDPIEPDFPEKVVQLLLSGTLPRRSSD
jgi:AcrR family transcriptional regulator